MPREFLLLIGSLAVSLGLLVEIARAESYGRAGLVLLGCGALALFLSSIRIDQPVPPRARRPQSSTQRVPRRGATLQPPDQPINDESAPPPPTV